MVFPPISMHPPSSIQSAGHSMKVCTPLFPACAVTYGVSPLSGVTLFAVMLFVLRTSNSEVILYARWPPFVITCSCPWRFGYGHHRIRRCWSTVRSRTAGR